MAGEQWLVAGAGIQYQAPDQDALDKRLEAADKPGRHLWVVLAGWVVAHPARQRYEMDAENLVVIQGPGCFKCEEPYSERIARQPCRGSASSLMP